MSGVGDANSAVSFNPGVPGVEVRRVFGELQAARTVNAAMKSPRIDTRIFTDT